MYSKTRNTLTALIVASLFLTAGWMFGRPVEGQLTPSKQNVARPCRSSIARLRHASPRQRSASASSCMRATPTA